MRSCRPPALRKKAVSPFLIEFLGLRASPGSLPSWSLFLPGRRHLIPPVDPCSEIPFLILSSLLRALRLLFYIFPGIWTRGGFQTVPVPHALPSSPVTACFDLFFSRCTLLTRKWYLKGDYSLIPVFSSMPFFSHAATYERDAQFSFARLASRIASLSSFLWTYFSVFLIALNSKLGEGIPSRLQPRRLNRYVPLQLADCPRSSSLCTDPAAARDEKTTFFPH